MLYKTVTRLLTATIIALVFLPLTGCAGLSPEPIMGTINSDSLQSIDDISNVVNTTNIPIKYIILTALAAWCIRTPWGLVSDFLSVRRGLL